MSVFKGALSKASVNSFNIIEVGTVMHACESELVVKSIIKTHVPYFNGKVFLANKQEIGSVEEILGPVNNYFFSVKLNEGFNARTFTPNTMLHIDTRQQLPITNFFPKAIMEKKVSNRGGFDPKKKGIKKPQPYVYEILFT